ncbi:MAG: transglycosylase domain-containing protein [Chloroflexi bacterium]|nr:transglycosylase domain-containing protein [Chloroflexota bacterium]
MFIRVPPLMPSLSARQVIHRRRTRREAAHTGFARVWRLLVTLLLVKVTVVAVALTGSGIALAQAYSNYVTDLPSSETLQTAFSSSNNQFFQTTKRYDRTGARLLYEVIDPRAGDRQWLGIEKIPKYFVQATLAIEDKNFYTNPGYDYEGILRAFVSNLRGGAVQGGSTITQQLVKNVIIAPGQSAERSYDRKLRELLIAVEVTKRYNKDQILEWYLNTNFYGNLAYGVDAASRVYFGKPASELDLAESALLSAIPQYPALNPLDAPAEAKQRQELVLDAMTREGYISSAQAQAAKAEDVIGHLQSFNKRFDIRAPHFSFYVIGELAKRLGPELTFRGGLKVITSIDLDLQDQAECATRTQVARLAGGDPAQTIPTVTGQPCAAAAYLPATRAADAGVDHNVSNASVVVLDARSGEILALVGSLDYWNDAIDGRFNAAVDGRRQPGSSFKPFTYLTAFSLGYTPATMVLDVRTAFPSDSGIPYVPEDYDRQFHGPVSLRIALARSYNIPAVEMMNRVGVENVIRAAHRMGINTLDRPSSFYGLSLALGGGEVSLLDMTYAYGVMANHGRMAGQPVSPEARRSGFRTLDPVSILRIEDSKGNALFNFEPKTQQVLSEPLAYLITGLHPADCCRGVGGQHRFAAHAKGHRPHRGRAHLAGGDEVRHRNAAPAARGLDRAAGDVARHRVLPLRPAAHPRLPERRQRSFHQRHRAGELRQHLAIVSGEPRHEQTGHGVHPAGADRESGVRNSTARGRRLAAAGRAAPAAHRIRFRLRPAGYQPQRQREHRFAHAVRLRPRHRAHHRHGQGRQLLALPPAVRAGAESPGVDSGWRRPGRPG